MDERELIRRSQAGEKEAIEELLGRYEGLVYNLALRYFGEESEAADAGQEAMLRIYRSLPRFKGESSFKTWVYRVTTNVCLDLLRRRERRDLPLLETTAGEPFLAASSFLDDPVAYTEQKELGALLEQLVRTLSLPQRIVLVLRDLEGLSYEEIAFVLGWAPGTIKSRLARARAALRRKFLAHPRASGWVDRRLRA
ncbi:MAG: sigma-70 family RNA polymerase sigma factor [Firmicutes bacterium]|nr:sigma-70 family RNA polymerase sigma factor [Bacillota bacterium]